MGFFIPKLKRPESMRFESSPGTFTGGQTVVIDVWPNRDNGFELDMNVSKATPPFTEFEMEHEYRPWVTACLQMAAKHFQSSKYLKNEAREKQGVKRL